MHVRFWPMLACAAAQMPMPNADYDRSEPAPLPPGQRKRAAAPGR